MAWLTHSNWYLSTCNMMWELSKVIWEKCRHCEKILAVWRRSELSSATYRLLSALHQTWEDLSSTVFTVCHTFDRDVSRNGFSSSQTEFCHNHFSPENFIIFRVLVKLIFQQCFGPSTLAKKYSCGGTKKPKVMSCKSARYCGMQDTVGCCPKYFPFSPNVHYTEESEIPNHTNTEGCQTATTLWKKSGKHPQKRDSQKMMHPTNSQL